MSVPDFDDWIANMSESERRAFAEALDRAASGPVSKTPDCHLPQPGERTLERARKEAVRYIMLDNEGFEVERYHQDDESDVVFASRIPDLLDEVAERVFDFGMDDLLAEMRPGGEYEGYKVVRQVVSTEELLPEEQALVDKLMEEAGE